MNRPKLIVFDLDYTLWPFYVDCHTSPPFKKNSDGTVVDTQGMKIKYYRDVPELLQKLKSEGYLLAVASRTTTPDGAQQLLNLFDWDKYFSFKEMYPGCKVTHFQRIAKDSGVAYNEMVFFDDEHRNIFDLKKLGVTAVLVNKGMSLQLLQQTLRGFAPK